MIDRGGKFFVRGFGKSGLRQIRDAGIVGIELDDNNARIELGLRDGRVEVRGDDSLILRPIASNLVEVDLDRDYLRTPDIVETEDEAENFRIAKRALDRLHLISNSLCLAENTKTRAARERVIESIRECSDDLKRVVG